MKSLNANLQDDLLFAIMNASLCTEHVVDLLKILYYIIITLNVITKFFINEMYFGVVVSLLCSSIPKGIDFWFLDKNVQHIKKKQIKIDAK